MIEGIERWMQGFLFGLRVGMLAASCGVSSWGLRSFGEFCEVGKGLHSSGSTAHVSPLPRFVTTS